MRILLIAMLAFPSVTQANFFNGNKIYEACNDRSNSAYLGYATGVMDAFLAYPTADTKICLSEGVVSQQIADVLCRYVENHPEHRNYAGSSVARAAFAEVWPCPS